MSAGASVQGSGSCTPVDSPKAEPRSPKSGSTFGEGKRDSSELLPGNGGALVQTASAENTPHNKSGGESGGNVQKGGNKKSISKSGEKDKCKAQADADKDAKGQQMARPWRNSTEGDKIRVQSRHVKKH